MQLKCKPEQWRFFRTGSAGERCGLDPETEAPEQNTVNM